MSKRKMVKTLIIEECQKEPKPSRDEIVSFVTRQLASEEPMTDRELDEWTVVVTQMVDNYY